MFEKIEPTIYLEIYMAGDLNLAREVIREYCFEVGFCVNLTPTDFVYSGGEENGFRVGIINYPRFPSDLEALEERAVQLGKLLMIRLCQRSFCIVGPRGTAWYSRKMPFESGE